MRLRISCGCLSIVWWIVAILPKLGSASSILFFECSTLWIISSSSLNVRFFCWLLPSSGLASSFSSQPFSSAVSISLSSLSSSVRMSESSRKVAGSLIPESAVFFLDFFYWNKVDLQRCVNFCCTARWLSYTYITFLFIFFSVMVYHKILKSSLCYRVGPCCYSRCVWNLRLLAPNSRLSLPSAP